MYVESSGDVDVSIRVENFSHDKHDWAKGGIMIRSSLAKDSAHYSAFTTGGNGVAQQLRRYSGYMSEHSGIGSIPSQHKARFVKITVPGFKSINIAEIQVFDNSNVNRALASEGASATQSSTYFWDASTPCPASIAIDGNTAEQTGVGLICDGLAHTNDETDPWIMVDLRSSYEISHVVIWNRLSCCSERLSGATVSLLDENSDIIRQVNSIGDTTNLPSVQLNINSFAVVKNPPTESIWLRVTKTGNVMKAYYREEYSSFWIPFGKEISMTSISSNGYYIGMVVTAHENSNPEMMADLKVSEFNVHRSCSSASITPEQCEQAMNCELGLRTSTCYEAGSIKTRKVKIHLPTTQYLHLAEVQVFNEYGNNVALNKPAEMSSVYDAQYHPYAADGNDGIIVDSMFHTNVEEGAWWEVDLLDPEVITEVHIYNRKYNCDESCQARANGAIVSLIDAKGGVFDTRDIGVVVIESAEAPPAPIDVVFSPVPAGSYLSLAAKVKIQLQDTDYLHLSEVQVFDEVGVNRALNKPSTMSSLYNSYAADESPGQGVDGITSGANFFHTDIEYQAWWEVDLVDAVHVKQIVLYNRQDCDNCQQRLSNAIISLIDSHGNVFDQKNVGDTAGVTQLILNFEEIKRSVLPPKELEAVSPNSALYTSIA